MYKNDREYSNGEIKVLWKPSLCIHSTICFVELPDVFKPGKRPWVNINGASTKRIIEVVDRCPTAALTWERIEVSATSAAFDQDSNAGKIKIKIFDDGPICISGNNIELSFEDGNVINKEGRVSLCRCGKSSSKPFCDGSHLEK